MQYAGRWQKEKSGYTGDLTVQKIRNHLLQTENMTWLTHLFFKLKPSNFSTLILSLAHFLTAPQTSPYCKLDFSSQKKKVGTKNNFQRGALARLTIIFTRPPTRGVSTTVGTLIPGLGTIGLAS